MSIFYTCVILIELKEQQKCPVYRICIVKLCQYLLSSLLDHFKCFNFPMNCPQDSQIFGIMTTNVSKFARGSGIVTRHRLTCDMWHYTGVASVTVSWVRGMCPQSGPIVPGPASSGQTEYFMRARVTGEGWFNGRCFNKIELYLITTQWNLEGGWNTLFMMSKGNLIKKKLSFLFVPTWDHLVFVDFCRLSTVKVRELHDEKIHIVTI